MILLLLAMLSCVACVNRHLRGTIEPSQDGHTYLAVVNNNGGNCGSIKVDGKVWPHPIGKPGPIEPGTHTIECGGEIGFEIRPGVVFKFDYWGP